MITKAMAPLPIYKGCVRQEVKVGFNQKWLLKLEGVLEIEHDNLHWLSPRIVVEIDRSKKRLRIRARGSYCRMTHSYIHRLHEGALSKGWEANLFEGKWMGLKEGGYTRTKGVELFYP